MKPARIFRVHSNHSDPFVSPPCSTPARPSPVNPSWQQSPVAWIVLLIAIVSLTDLRATDVSRCFVRKRQGFSQTSTNPPVWRTAKPFGFTADVYVDSIEAIQDANIRLPDGVSFPLAWNTNMAFRPTSYTFSEDFESAESLDAAYPGGVYTLSINTVHEGVKTITNNLPAVSYPNAPWVNNYTAAQSVDTGQDFRLEWSPFVGRTTNDTIVVELWHYRSPGTNRAFLTPTDPPFCGTNTSVVIPANALAAGQTYQAFLVFTTVTDQNTNAYPGVSCTAGFVSYTMFQVHTLPDLWISAGEQTTTLSWSRPSDGFMLQTATSLNVSDGWTWVTNTPVILDDRFTLSFPATNDTTFYRLSRD